MKLFTNLFTLLYPVIFFMGKNLPPYLISSLLLGVAMVNLVLLVIVQKWHDMIVPIVFLVVGFLSFFADSDHIFKMVPAVISVYFFILFAKSNFSDKSLIETFAAMKHIGKFDAREIHYLKKLNWVWTWFMLGNVSVQIVMIFMPLYLWVLYSTVISYLLMGGLFILEYGYRKLIWEPKNR